MCITLPDILPRSNEFINFKYLEGPLSTLFLTIIIVVYINMKYHAENRGSGKS